MSEKDIVSSFISGAADMVGVALVVGVSRGISFMMANSGLDLYILDKASGVLSGVSGMLFANMAYLIYIALSFFQYHQHQALHQFQCQYLHHLLID